MFRTLATIVRLLYSGPKPTDTMHVINTTRQLWSGILSRFYPMYAAQIMKKDAANKLLLSQEIDKATAEGVAVDPEILATLDSIEALYRASHDANPKWNEGVEEEKAEKGLVR